MYADDGAALANEISELVREEVRRVAATGRNWKLILNGSSMGDVRLIVEEHAEVKRRCIIRQPNT
jgi:hypothetical protein